MRNRAAPTTDPNRPPTIITEPIFMSTPPRRAWTITPETLTPVIGVEAVKPRLRPAPDTEPAGEIAEQRPRQRQPAIDEAVASDEAALEVSVETEAPRHRPVVDAAFEEYGEGVAPVAKFPEPLPALGGEPQGNVDEGLDAHARRHL